MESGLKSWIVVGTVQNSIVVQWNSCGSGWILSGE